jgi:hypothetical protein
MTTSFKSKLLIQSALIRLRQKDPPMAMVWLRDAVEAARRGLDTATEAQAWNELGNALLETGHPLTAEPPSIHAHWPPFNWLPASATSSTSPVNILRQRITD